MALRERMLTRTSWESRNVVGKYATEASFVRGRGLDLRGGTLGVHHSCCPFAASSVRVGG